MFKDRTRAPCAHPTHSSVDVRRTPRSLTCPLLTETKTGQYTPPSQRVCYSFNTAPPSLCFSSSRSFFPSTVPCYTCDYLILWIWDHGVGREIPLETRVCHGRLSSRELTRIGPAPCHVSVGVGIGSTGSSLRFVLSTMAGYILPGVCFVYASVPPVNQFMSKTWPVFTLGIHFLRRTYLALPLSGYTQVVGQGVASIDS